MSFTWVRVSLLRPPSTFGFFPSSESVSWIVAEIVLARGPDEPVSFEDPP